MKIIIKKKHIFKVKYVHTTDKKTEKFVYNFIIVISVFVCTAINSNSI